MKYFSLFSGIGGFENGIQRATQQISSTSKRQAEIGDSRILNNEARSNLRYSRQPSTTCVGFSEIDKYAIQIYKKHFPTHKEYGNVTNIKWSDVPDFELLCGGFPCQSFSIAGKRGGFLDTRGTLFFQIARAAQEKQPRLLLLENVKGLLSHDKGRTFGTILNTLDEIGYDLQWQVLNSKNFGVPQNRERIFLIGHLRGTSRPEVFPLRQTNKIHPGNNNQQIAKCLDSNYHKGWLDHGQKTMIALTETRTEKAKEIRRNTIDRDFSPRRGKVLVPRNDNIGNCVTGGQSKESFLTNGVKIRRLTPTECERLQGFPDGWTKGISDTQRYKCLGNAITINVIEAIMEKLIKNLTSPADCVKLG